MKWDYNSTTEEVIENLQVGDTLPFYFLYDYGNTGNEDELLESGSSWAGNDEDEIPLVAEFVIVKQAEDPLDTIVKITSIS